MRNYSRVRRCVLGLLFVALVVLGVVRRPAAQGLFVNVTIHMVAEPTLSGRVGLIPLGSLCDVNDQIGVLQPNGDTTSQCTYQIASGTVLRLVANVPGGSGMPGVFSSSTGSANCGPYSSCQFTITENSDVTATFSNSTLTYTMTVNLAWAPGEVGTDNSRCQNYDFHPANLPTQGTECVTRYARGSVVTSEAWPPVGSRFVAFSQGTNDAAICGANATCAFPLSGDTSITASFSALTSLAVAPSTATIGIGETQLFTQSATYADGVSAPLLPFHMGTWTTKTSMNHARYSFGAASVGNRIYAIGGSSVSGPLDSTEVYDPSANAGLGAWSATASTPSPLAGFGIGTSDNRYIYAVGGSTTNACPVDTLLRYDTVTDAWETKKPMPGGARRFLTAAVVGRTLYAIGGELNLCNTTSGTTLNRVEAYDIDSDTWTPKAPLPTGRRFLAAGVVHGIIYVVGGDNAGDPSVSATVEAYDPASATWSTRAPLPNGRKLVAADVIDDVLYAVGGLETGSFRNSLYAYDASTNTWSSKLPIPAVQYAVAPISEFGGERAELAVAALGGRLYALGGLGGPGPSIPQNIPFVLAFSDNLIWSTGTPNVATIDQNFQNGLAHALSLGSTDVIARSGTITCAPGACGVLTVTNGPPGVTMGSPNPRTISEGQSISVSGSFSDLAADGPWTASISYGDGSPAESLGSFTSAGFFNSSSHQYKDNGTFNASVSVTDSHGITGTGTLQVIVTNVAPRVFLGVSASVNVGSTSPFTCATFSDPGVNDGPWTATADFGDGTGGQQAVAPVSCGGGGGNPPTGSFLLRHSYSQAGTFPLTVTVTDKDGGAGSSTMQVTVSLAQINLGIPNSTSTQVNNANWGCGRFSDPNGGSWLGSIDYGDRSGTQGLPLTVPASGPCASGGGSPTGSFSFNHAYSTAGTFTVNLTISNTTTGGSRSGSVSVTVNAAQMFLNIPSSASTQVNSTSSFGCGWFSDGNGGSWTGTVNYGDGPADQPLPLVVPPSGPCASRGGGTPPTGVFSLNHAYSVGGTFQVSVTILNTVTGTSKSRGFTVTVTDNRCAQVTLTVAGTVPFTTLPVSVTYNGVPQSGANAVDVGANILKLTLGEEGTYHVQFLPPAGYTATPDHLDFTVVCGTNLAFNVLVAVADTTPPVLTLNGANPLTVEGGTAFTDPGATATDAVDGNLTASIQASGSVNANLVGKYTVTYAVHDHAGNAASATRIVNVVDTMPPVLTLNGANPMSVEAGALFVDPGATAFDTLAGNLTPAIRVSGAVDAHTIGSYLLTYTVSDGSNTTVRTRTINVADTTPPLAACTAVPRKLQKGDDNDDDDELGKALFRVTGSDAIGPLSLKIGTYALVNGEVIQLSVKRQAGVLEISKTKKTGIRRFSVGQSDAFILARDGAGNSTKAVCALPARGDSDGDSKKNEKKD